MRAFAALIVVLCCASGAPASAQSAAPDTVRAAGVTQAQWDAVRREARAQAQRARVSEAALLAAAEAASIRLAGAGRFDAPSLQQAVVAALAGQADRIAELQRRLGTLSGDRDPGVAAMFDEARAALDAGRFDEADRLLAQVSQGDLAAIGKADAEVERRRLRAGQTIASRGLVAFVRADYMLAAEQNARAADIVPESALAERWQFTIWRAGALFERSRLFEEPEPLRQAVAAYETALALRPRATAPADWAIAQNNLGNALSLQGRRGAPGALERATTAFEAALSVMTRDADPGSWATIQNNLGIVLAIQGARGAPRAMERAVTAFEAALTVMTREADPVGWADLQVNLGNTLRRLSERGAPGALERAVSAYEAALTVMTREADAAGWAEAQANLGVALKMQAERGAAGALERAVAAYEAALTVMTRESNPAGWAVTQVNLGNAFTLQHERGAPGAAQRAVAAFEAALTVFTREANAAGWADTQFNLALAYRALGRDGEARTAMQGAQAVYAQLGDRSSANQARLFIAQLPGK